MVDECLMTEDCPGYDREHRVCLVGPEDCEFAPAATERHPAVDGGVNRSQQGRAAARRRQPQRRGDVA